jgi:hypothetical protein
MSKLGHLFKSVCNKLSVFKLVVAKFCNNNKFTSELVSVSVSKVSRDLERIKDSVC